MIVSARIDSAHLTNNILNDPSERDVYVYLPPGYDGSDRHYPSVYLLHAYGETPDQLMRPSTVRWQWLPPMEDILDPVFGRLGAPP